MSFHCPPASIVASEMSNITCLVDALSVMSCFSLAVFVLTFSCLTMMCLCGNLCIKSYLWLSNIYPVLSLSIEIFIEFGKFKVIIFSKYFVFSLPSPGTHIIYTGTFVVASQVSRGSFKIFSLH